MDARGIIDGVRRGQHVSATAPPHDATLGNFRELFAHAGVGRYLVNSVLLALCATLLSLLFNVAAGYAFAKLRFAGRDASSADLGAQ